MVMTTTFVHPPNTANDSSSNKKRAKAIATPNNSHPHTHHIKNHVAAFAVSEAHHFVDPVLAPAQQTPSLGGEGAGGDGARGGRVFYL